jgi:hypothetical protein
MLVLLLEDGRMGRCDQCDNHRSCLDGFRIGLLDEIPRQLMVPYRNHLTTIFLFFRFLLSNVPEKA